MSQDRFQTGNFKEMDTRQLVLDCGLPAEPGESRKAMLLRAARQAGLSYARMVAFFYGKGSPPPEAKEKLASEAKRIRREWLDIQMDQRLAELAAEHDRLLREREEIDRQVAGIARALAHGRRAEDRQ